MARAHVNLEPADVLRHLSPEGQLHWEIALLKATVEALGSQLDTEDDAPDHAHGDSEG